MTQTNGNMEASTNKKRKQKLVKHKRKNWKKTDISEIERGIDELKQELRTGGVRAEKKDEDLFFIDKKKQAEEPLTTVAQQKKALDEALSDLRCYKSLQPDVHSEPALLRNNRTAQGSSKKTVKRLKKKAKKEEKRDELVKDRVKKVKPSTDNRFEFVQDLWTAKFRPDVNHTNEFYLQTTKQVVIKKPKNFDKKTSAIPAVEVPHPGASYNPTYDEHQDLLNKANQIEMIRIKKEERLVRNLDAKIPKMSHEQIEQIWLSEMSGTLFDKETNQPDNDEDGEHNIDDEIVKAKFQKNSNSKKSKRERAMEKQRDEEKQRRIRVNEIYRLRTIKKEIAEDEQKTLKRIEKRENFETNKRLYGQSRLSKLKYEDAELELKLSDELSGNLRNLKPEGDIMADRYKSLQKRNIIEPRVRAKRERKYWKKTYEKKSSREITA